MLYYLIAQSFRRLFTPPWMELFLELWPERKPAYCLHAQSGMIWQFFSWLKAHFEMQSGAKLCN